MVCRAAHRFPMLARPQPGSDGMRGDDRQQGAMFSYLSPEERVPRDHPLRAIRELVDQALAELAPRFSRLFARLGRPPLPPPPPPARPPLLAGPLPRARGPPAKGAARLQHALPRVRGAKSGRASLGGDGVHEE